MIRPKGIDDMYRCIRTVSDMLRIDKRHQMIVRVCESRQLEEESEEFVVLQCIGQVEVLQGRDQIDQISCGYNDACFLFFNEITNILLKGLGVARVGSSEPSREDVVATAQRLLDITSVGHVQHSLQLHRFFVNAVKIYLSLELLVPSEETAPIRLQVLLLLHRFFLSARMDVQNVPDLVYFVLVRFWVGVGVGVVGEGIGRRWKGRAGIRIVLLLGCLRVLLAFALISELIVDVRVETSDFIVIDEDGDFALTVSQLVSLQFHFLSCPHSLCQGFIFDEHIGPLRGQLIPLDFQIPNVSKSGEK